MVQTYSISDSSIERLFNQLDGYELSYSYRGDFSQQLTDSILALSETNMEVTNEPIKNRKKVYFIMVESLQNITRHQDTEVLEGFFSIHKSSTGFLITSGNVVENVHVEPLREKLDKVNSMSAEQLKEYYYEVLNAGGFSEKGGAGLGLIEMVRKSGNKLSYDFKKVDDRLSFFYFQINVNTDGSGGNTSVAALNNNLNLAKSVHNVVTENKVRLFFHGRFDHESLKGLLTMAETSLSMTVSTTFKKTVVAVMIEMLQNICYHGVDKTENSGDKPGLILLSEDGTGYYMITGNYISNDKVEKFVKHVDQINALNEDGLNNLYNEVILRENKIGELGAGLGLIDLRFKTRNRIETSIMERSASRSFLIVKSHINI
jgi:hypothetical protein